VVWGWFWRGKEEGLIQCHVRTIPRSNRAFRACNRVAIIVREIYRERFETPECCSITRITILLWNASEHVGVTFMIGGKISPHLGNGSLKYQVISFYYLFILYIGTFHRVLLPRCITNWRSIYFFPRYLKAFRMQEISFASLSGTRVQRRMRVLVLQMIFLWSRPYVTERSQQKSTTGLKFNRGLKFYRGCRFYCRDSFMTQ